MLNTNQSWVLKLIARQRKWDVRFLELAKYIAQWSKDPSTKIGSVIVNDKNQVIGMGYNGFPRGVEDTDERLNDRPTKYSMVVHAEVNTILNATGKTEGCTLYTYPSLMVPANCNECAKVIIQAGIKRVVCYKVENIEERWRKQAEISEIMFREAGIYIEILTE